MNRGYIKLWRKIWNHKFFQEKRRFSRFEAWVDLIMLANGKAKEILFDGKPILIKRGQVLTSQRKLAARWGWSKTKTADFLKLSSKHDHAIEIISDRKKSIITILNYEKYNPLPGNEKTTEFEPKKTTERPQKDHRLALTNKSIINVNKDNIYTITRHWNSENIITLEDRETKVKNKTTAKIKSCLKKYSLTEIIEAIDNYSRIIKSDDHFFSHKWQLWEFLDRGLTKFLTKNNPFDNYLKHKTNKPQTYVGNQQPFTKEDEKRFPQIDKEYLKIKVAYMKKEGIDSEDDLPFKFPSLTDYRLRKIRETRKQRRSDY